MGSTQTCPDAVQTPLLLAARHSSRRHVATAAVALPVAGATHSQYQSPETVVFGSTQSWACAVQTPCPHEGQVVVHSSSVQGPSTPGGGSE